MVNYGFVLVPLYVYPAFNGTQGMETIALTPTIVLDIC